MIVAAADVPPHSGYTGGKTERLRLTTTSSDAQGLGVSSTVKANRNLTSVPIDPRHAARQVQP